MSAPYGYPQTPANLANMIVEDTDGTIGHYYDMYSGLVIDRSSAGKSPKITLRRNVIRIDCARVTPEVLRFILSEYDKKFPSLEAHILQ